MKHYSVVIPTFGRIKFLKDCLQSVDDQLVRPQEVFIIGQITPSWLIKNQLKKSWQVFH